VSQPTDAAVRATTTDESEDFGDAARAPVATKFPLDVRKAEFSIYELHRRWREGHLRLDPDFQREFVWSNEKQIKLVESVLALIPLPVIYLSDDGESLEVVDGQQRLTTIFAFIEGRFAASHDAGKTILRRDEQPGLGRHFRLRDLRLMKDFEGVGYEELDRKMRRKFEETPLTCFVLHAQTDPRAKYELFERINEGTKPLVAQEIRNALFHGPGLDLVNRLASPGGPFREVAGSHRSFARMRANELVLRGLAFAWRGWEPYRGDLVEFLNDSLRQLNLLAARDLERVEASFLGAVDFAAAVFGATAWQRFDPDTGMGSGHVSGPLVEAVSFAASRVFPDALPSPEQAEKIRRGFQGLCKDSKFNAAILTATQTQKNVEYRMKALEKVLRDAS
jgi:hypothetical protein